MAKDKGVDVTLFRALSFASRQLNAVVEDGLREGAGVSLPEFDILSALHAASEHRARAGELGHMIAWEKSRLSHQLSRMERKGLVQRFSCGDDQRGTWVTLTELGAQTVERARPVYLETIHAHLGDLAEAPSGADLAQQILNVGHRVSPPSCRGELEVLNESLSTSPRS